MKKCLCIIFALMILLTSCNHKPKTIEITSSTEKNNSVYDEPINWNDSSVYNTGHEFSFYTESDSSDYNVQKEISVHPYENSIAFFSFADFKSGLKKGITDDMINEMDSKVERNDENTCKEFIRTIRQKNEVIIPCYKGELISNPINSDHLYCVLFASGYFEKPALCFPVDVDGTTIIIDTVTLDSSMADMADTKGSSWLIDQLSSKRVNKRQYPNIDNYNDFEDVKIAYESELPLGDRVVKSMILEYKESERLKVYFVYDDSFVIVRISPDNLKNGFLKNLSFKSVSLD